MGRVFTDLLEPDLERGIQDRDERHRLLTRTLADGKEVCLVLCANELLGGQWVRLEELGYKRRGLVEICETLQNRRLGTAVGASEALFDAPEPVASQVAQGPVDPALLVSNEHEPNHAQDRFLVATTPISDRQSLKTIQGDSRHVCDVLDNRTVLARTEPWLGEVCIELADHLRATLS
jgi:hypothetical protein